MPRPPIPDSLIGAEHDLMLVAFEECQSSLISEVRQKLAHLQKSLAVGAIAWQNGVHNGEKDMSAGQIAVEHIAHLRDGSASQKLQEKGQTSLDASPDVKNACSKAVPMDLTALEALEEKEEDGPYNWEAHLSVATKDLEETVTRNWEAKSQAKEFKDIHRMPFLQRVVEHPCFDVLTVLLVVMNMIAMLLQSEMHGEVLRKRLYHNSLDTAQEVDDIFAVFDSAFTSIFLVELVMRLKVYGLHYLRESVLNLFDALIVVSGCIETFLLPILSGSSGGINLSCLRIIRLLKLLKLLNAFRAASEFSELRVIVQTLITTGASIMWCAIFVSLIVIASGMLMSQLVYDVIEDESLDIELRDWIFRNYGSTARAAWTMTQVTLSGGWPLYAQPLVEHVNTWFVLFWILYVIFVVFAVMKTLSALFIRATLKAAANDEEMMIKEKMKEGKHTAEKIRHLFSQADASGDGRLDKDEFVTMVSDERVLAWLKLLELETHEIVMLFNMLLDHDDKVSVEDFIDSALRMKGTARAIDAIIILRQTQSLAMEVRKIKGGMSKLGRLIVQTSGAT